MNPAKVDRQTAWTYFAKIAEDDPRRNHHVRMAVGRTLWNLNPHSHYVYDHTRDKGDFNFEPPPVLMPTGEMGGDVALLSLPYCLSADIHAGYTQTGHDLVQSLLAEKPLGVIVDLTTNGGGGCHPMLATMSSLLDKDNHVYWADTKAAPGAQCTIGVTWDHTTGRARNSGVLDTSIPQCVAAPNTSMPIAIIYGEKTASSGEVAALSLIGHPLAKSFGSATAGSTTGNANFDTPFPEFFDKGAIALTRSTMADRNQRLYGGPIQPDIVTKTPVEEALLWLRQHAARKPF